jgi:hypothetical protein
MSSSKRLLSITLLMVLATSSIAWGRAVRCQTAAPLTDHSDASLESALADAVDACVRRATTMGLAWIRLEVAVVLDDRVIVRMIASDDEADGDEDGADNGTPRPAGPEPAALSW